MWLFVPGLFACAGLLVAFSYGARLEERRRIAQISIAFTIGCGSFALAHLAFVALTAPSDLLAWIEWVYLGLFSGRGVTAQKLSSDGASSASVWAYLGWLMRDHGALLSPLVLGLAAATRRMGRLRRSFFVASAFALLALVPLSVPVAKEPLYMAPVLPFFYALAALSLVAVDRTPARYMRVNRGAAKLALTLAAALATAAVWRVLDAQQPTGEALVSLAAVLIWTVPSVRVLSRRSVGPTILPCALASIGVSACALLARPLGLV
jgi:hypothetical protein